MGKVRLSIVSLLALLAFVGCGQADTASRNVSLQIGAAADLRTALTEAQSTIEEECAARIVFVFGSSGQLKEQILAGASFGLYLSADAAFPREVEAAGLTVEDGVAEYAVGRLALAWAPGIAPMSGAEDLLRDDVRYISIANPAHAPYGRAARETLVTLGLWEAAQGRLVLGENVRQATDYVEQGNAEAGLVALSLVIGTDIEYVVVPAELHKPITQAGAVIAGKGVDTESRCVLDYLRGASGQSMLQRYGFEPVP